MNPKIIHGPQNLYLLTLDDVDEDGGGGGVVGPTLPDAGEAGGDVLQEERDHGDLGLVHHQTDARLESRHLEREI